MGFAGTMGITTVFPQAIGLAATWNINLASQQGIAQMKLEAWQMIEAMIGT